MKIILFLTVFLFSSSCYSQQVYPLNTDFDEVPQNSYLKDSNNELTPYIGTYKSSFQNREITIYITKEVQKFFKALRVYQDALSIRYVVKNSAGAILQDTQSMTFQPNQFEHTIYSHGTYPNQNIVWFNYGGTNCRVGWGAIELKKISTTQLSWEYRPNDIILDSSKCPQGTDINIYLPETKGLIFTKQ
ncbi:hypothetical protein CEY12_16420 [Chryseobacterium sp. T16E-39]|uniref:DUF6705 family protein n=1 Tax=Chryseobacterium sp. T16E-39 TaxID=2015076 RepID=UPI000B5B338E|nr:DUF6705 family protein [Chryseobacterium sp. T16E-39]ASK31600.1 hypothetical protein CEY12_16420 [Chryseobacterium sp. T16E-39]